ncbi:Gfo/Idh/MocA family protein [Elongatibacter sediminis]|uniref:Gfo/Idh/MocA family oxidoreductase n=1 Tax=Elongatibacter sediminis TaxID=3119006 RepID=A0AAW9RF96_9GAMM
MSPQDQPVRLGILGTGRMARDFAEGLKHAPSIRLQAVASRRQDAADRFASDFAVPDATEGLDRMLANPDVELVYIATPHAMHCDDTLACLEAGKHVLCEKPFAINAKQAERMVAAARAHNRFLMEAMWTRYLPAVTRLRELLDEGVLGRSRLMVAGGAFMPPFDPDDYLFRPDLGGGVLLDAGVYLVSWASWLFGQPEQIMATGRIGDSGVDEHDAVLLEHADGSTAQLYVSLQAKRSPDVMIAGERGSIHIHPPVFAPRGLTLKLDGADEQHLDLPFAGNGYQFEAEEAARCIRQGRTESSRMPLDETLQIMRTLDTIRARIGLRYPMED